MDVQLTKDQQAFAREAVASGRLLREEQAVEEALVLWEERERARASLTASLELAKASLGRAEGRVITKASMSELAEEIKARGRARLSAETSPSLGQFERVLQFLAA